MRRQPRVATFPGNAARKGDHYIESVAWQAALESFGPLDHRCAVIQRLVEADLIGFVR
jgi:hypothetical protein